MDPTSPYSQMMIQQLMNSPTMAPGMGGQNATTPYGAGFMTGNMSMPMSMQQPQMGSNGQPQGMLGQGPASMLQQPMATYS